MSETCDIYEVTYALEILPALMEIWNETVLLVLVYRKLGPLGSTMQDPVVVLSELPTECRTLGVGNFNLDKLLYKNIHMLGDTK